MHPRADAFIKTFKTAAEQEQMLVRRQRTCRGLAKWLTLRGEHHHLRGVVCQLVYRFKDRFGLEHHSRAAAVRGAIHRAVSVVCPFPQIVEGELQPAAFAGTAQDAFIHRPREHRGEKREHVHLHCCGCVARRARLIVVFVLNDFQTAAHSFFGAPSLDERADGVDCHAASANHFGDIIGIHSQFVNGGAVVFHFGHVNCFGFIDQPFDHIFHKI